MGKHRDWRKIAKRERRRRIRIKNAKEKDLLQLSDGCVNEKWLVMQAELEEQERNENERQNREEHDKWLKAEHFAMEQWKLLQEKKEKIHQEKMELEAKIRLEWEQEKKRKEEEAQRLAEIKEANKKRQEEFMNNLEKFLNGDSDTPPPELLTSHETKPNADLCPFFSKTGCCRFGDQCSRNHQYPGISKVLLAPNFYTHFGLENAGYNEYDTDVMLEYEDSDTYKEFKEFFYDILPEFEKFGKIVQLKTDLYNRMIKKLLKAAAANPQKVCNNYEKHLRGNTYVEYAALRSAVAAYRALHTRWYGGKQLSLEFCLINSWKNAICGLQSAKRCPKGRACNFLHVFRNPKNLFNSRYTISEEVSRTPRRPWRWSESPEPETQKEKRPQTRDRKHHRHSSRRRRRSRSRD